MRASGKIKWVTAKKHRIDCRFWRKRRMDYLPKNPAILVSSINMLLRDEEYESLESLCDNFNTNAEQIKAYLHEAGYVYSEEQEQFRPIGFDE